MKPNDDSGRELDAIFTVEPAVNGMYLTLESRGGADGGPRPARNADYAPAMELLLRRLGLQGAVITGIEVYSGVTQHWPAEDRQVNLVEFPLPIQLGASFNVKAFRLQLGRASAAMGRPDGAAGGNRTKRMRFRLQWSQASGRTAVELEELLARRSSSNRDGERQYEPLGRYLRAQTASRVSLTLAEISGIIGQPLPQQAEERNFWANTHHHPSRRDQWLKAGYKAYLRPQVATVEFERFLNRQIPTADTKQLDDRVSAAKEELEALPSNLQVPPPGNSEVQQATTATRRFIRDPNVIAWVLVISGGACEACGQPAPFKRADGEPFLEVHHLRPLAEGGPDQVDNALATCPNCHRRFHHGADREAFRSAALAKVQRLVSYPPSPVRVAAAASTALVTTEEED